MPIHTERAREFLREFDFHRLFVEELGWDHHDALLRISIPEDSFNLSAVSHKHGMVVFTCGPMTDGNIPGYSIRRKIERTVTRSVHEHIVIYTDSAKTTQVWQWVRRQVGRPTMCREHTYLKGQPGDSLLQKLEEIAFSLVEEEGLTLVDVTSRVRAAFDVDKVTKHFFERFKVQRLAFMKFVEGIPDEQMRRWYVSVILDRLMFIYFVQKKGFMDGDTDYLQSKLEVSRMRGKDSYYREFLHALFFEGFAKKKAERSPSVNELLGEVPYLNGSLFALHQIEETHGDTIQIEDAAFDRIFAFFEKYQWHLDQRPLRMDNEINPDVLGYIFERYINQRELGAYYSKEDITGYIARNTVLPCILDLTEGKCKIAFEGEESVWRMLQSDPDRYIYPAVKHSVAWALPPAVSGGAGDVSKRTGWNEPADEPYALPTELWREVVARRQRYEKVRSRLAAGEVREIKDLITLNLDISQFVQDAVETCEGPELLRAFWFALRRMKVLDPACGSGAFLFAALNALEPLYEACLDRMQVFIDESDRSGTMEERKKFSDFRRILEHVGKHPNRAYFILKSIIVHNLFGVDIVEEAVEICKLRLFLKLVAQIADPECIGPLPDIDFNIRTGNTLVGFARRGEVGRAVEKTLDFDNTMAKIEAKAQEVDLLFARFRQQQTELDGTPAPADKKDLQDKLATLEGELNRYLASEYGVDYKKSTRFEEWRLSHRPFHWFIEFYSILREGGFNAIIGNPPYVEYRNVRHKYKIRDYATEPCGDLYAFMMERSCDLLDERGYFGMIVPVSIMGTDGFNELRTCLRKPGRQSWCLGFSERPSKLFEGVEKRLAIWLLRQGCEQDDLFVSNYRRWFSEERENLFAMIRFVKTSNLTDKVGSSIPKASLDRELGILEAIFQQKKLGSFYVRSSPHVLYYTRKIRYFAQFLDFVPEIVDGEGKVIEPSELKSLCFVSRQDRDVAIAVLNSSLFFWFLNIYSDVRNVNRREVRSFPCSLDIMSEERARTLGQLSGELMNDLRKNSRRITSHYRNYGQLTIQSFQPRLSKPIIDKIDAALAGHYGLTDEELDFIINYDIKYRLGQDSLTMNDCS